MGCHKSLVLSQVSAKMAILVRYRVVNPSSNSTSSWSMWCHWRYISSHVTRDIDQDIRSFTCVYHLHWQLDFQIPKESIFVKNVAIKADKGKRQRPAFLERVKDKIPARSLFALLVQLLGENTMWSQEARKCEYVIIRRGNSPITLKLHRPFNLRKNAPQDVLRAA